PVAAGGRGARARPRFGRTRQADRPGRQSPRVRAQGRTLARIRARGRPPYSTWVAVHRAERPAVRPCPTPMTTAFPLPLGLDASGRSSHNAHPGAQTIPGNGREPARIPAPRSRPPPIRSPKESTQDEFPTPAHASVGDAFLRSLARLDTGQSASRTG